MDWIPLVLGSGAIGAVLVEIVRYLSKRGDRAAAALKDRRETHAAVEAALIVDRATDRGELWKRIEGLEQEVRLLRESFDREQEARFEAIRERELMAQANELLAEQVRQLIEQVNTLKEENRILRHQREQLEGEAAHKQHQLEALQGQLKSYLGPA